MIIFRTNFRQLLTPSSKIRTLFLNFLFFWSKWIFRSMCFFKFLWFFPSLNSKLLYIFESFSFSSHGNKVVYLTILTSGGGAIFVWGCMTPYGMGYMCKIEGWWHKLYILAFFKMGSWRQLNGMFNPSRVICKHDNDPKHIAKLVKQ